MKEKRFYNAREGHGWAYKLALQRLKGGEKVLDLCCGAGYGCEILLQKASSVLGVDYDPECIAWARIKHPRGSFKVCDLCKDPLPCSDRSVDFITWVEGIEHLQRIDVVMKGIHRVARPGAGLFLTTPASKRKDPRHKHYYMLEDLLKLFPAAADLGVQGWCGSRVIFWRSHGP